jgi:hypothetical protein
MDVKRGAWSVIAQSEAFKSIVKASQSDDGKSRRTCFLRARSRLSASPLGL